MVAILFYPEEGRRGGLWVGVRNDQTVERDRGVQYGLHTGTGLCHRMKGEDSSTKARLSVYTPESKCHCECRRGKERDG